MPQISRFFGIVIAMYHDDHQPPHFHARYAGRDIEVEIANGKVIGDFPLRARRLVLEWLDLRRVELEQDWQLVIAGKKPKWIAPLE